MSHSPYPNAYAQVYPTHSAFQQPGYPTTTAQYPNAYQDVYQQRAPSRNAYHSPSNSMTQDVASSGFYRQPNGSTQQIHVDPSSGPGAQRAVYSTPPTQSRHSPPRRPLPTPQARPGSHPAFDNRPLPAAHNDPRPSPSAPPATFHRPSFSASNVPSSSGFSARTIDSYASPTQSAVSQGTPRGSQISRPLPTPTSRATRSVDLTRSTTPVKDVANGYGYGPSTPGQSFSGSNFSPQRKRSLPVVPGQGSDHGHPGEQQHPLPELPNGSSLQRTGTGIRPLPPSPIQAQIVQPPPPRQPWSSNTPRTNTSEPIAPPTPTKSGFSTRDRSRVIPNALPPPTSALPQRPNLGRNESSASIISTPNTQSYRPGMADPVRDSPISSESEDMYENSLLQRPAQIRAPEPPGPNRGYPTRSMTTDNQRPSEPASTNSSPFKGGRPRRQSLVSQIAKLSLNGSTPDLHMNKESAAPVGSSPPKPQHPMLPMGRSSTQPTQPRWPAELPPLPRAPQAQSEPGERYPRSRQTSPTRQQPPPPQHPSHVTFPSDPQPSYQQRDTSPSRFPPPPQHPSTPTRSRFPPFQPQSRDTSPTRNPTQPPALPPRSNPASPTRGRFPQQAPIREPILPAPHPQRMIPDLDDAPPPSLRRSPSPARQSKFSSSSYQTSNGLPSIRTQDVQNSQAKPNVFSPPSAVTPSSAGSVFSLSQFPVPPQTHGRPTFGRSHSGDNRSREVSPARNGMPAISVTGSSNGWSNGPSISVSGPGQELPKISLPGMDDEDDTMQLPTISVGGPDDYLPQINVSNGHAPQQQRRAQNPVHPLPSVRSKGGLYCGGCGGPILGRSVNTMGANWHPGCFRCAACDQLLENLAMFEHEGRLYCSLDYYEKFAPRCYHCQTAIADQDYITLSQVDGLGDRTYHTQHFFCAECGDPFLPPSDTARNFSGDGTFDSGAGEGFTVYNGHPYCERCHVRLRMPKCKKCKKPLRQDQDVLEVLGGKWCPECFVCKGCDGPFINGRFFLRDEKPFCQRCFEIIIKSEL